MNFKYTVIISIFLFSCEKTLMPLKDVPFIESENIYDLVVEGGITTQHGKQFIKLTKPAKWLQESNLPETVSNAIIYITDKVDTFYLEEDYENQGDYYTLEEVSGKVGKIYYLYIKHNNKEYSASDSLVKSSEISEFVPGTIEQEKGDNIISINLTVHSFGFKSPALKVYNLPDFDELTPKQIYDEITNKALTCNLPPLTYFEHTGSPPQGLFPEDYSNIGFMGKVSDTIEVVQISLSENYYSFLITVLNETDWLGGFFSVAQGNVHTNVNNGGTGFFHASEIKKKYIQMKDFKNIE